MAKGTCTGDRRLGFLLLLVGLLGCGALLPPAPPSPGALVQAAPAAPPGSAPPSSAAPLLALEGPWSDADAFVPVDSDDPTWGSRAAPVTLVVFSDYQCPFCSRAQRTIEELQEKYGPGDLRVVWKNEPLPFHPNARPAAEAAMGVFALAGGDAFWQFTSAAMRNQRDLGEESYVTWATAAGVRDEGRFRQGLRASEWAPKVDRDHALAASLGVRGTPHFFVNGVEISGAQPLESFTVVIDAELASARDALAHGTRADRVYVERSRANGVVAPPPPQVAPSGDTDRGSGVFRVPVGSSPVRGPSSALVTIVEFTDFQCPFCQRAHETLRKVASAYGNKVRLVFKNRPLPFHDRAEPAAELAMFAFKERGNAGFWAVHDRLFAAPPVSLDDPGLSTIAKSAGLDVKRAMAAVSARAFQAQIQDDIDLADDVDAKGTPCFFLNGRRLSGAVPFDDFKERVDEALADARALVAKGTPASRLYDEILKVAKDAAPPDRKVIVASASGPVPSKGSPRARVVIEEFSDFECPYCQRVQATLGELLAAYGDKVRVEFRNRPLAMHPHARLAAEAAMEAFAQRGSAGFFRMHDLLLANQATAGGLEGPAIESYALDLHLDMDAFRKALADHVHLPRIEADGRAADTAQLQGTPNFVINGYVVSGAQPLAKFKKVVERALVEAKDRAR